MTERTCGQPRLASAEDAPRLKTLWKTVFGDDDADIEHFFSIYFSPELTIVISNGGLPAAAAYILPVGDLVLPAIKDSARRYPCAMLYAIGTLPEFRGRGYGEAVTRAAYEQAVKKGFPAVVLKPANSGLFEFYEKRTDFRAFFEAYEAEYAAAELFVATNPAADLPPDGLRYSFLPVSPAKYRRIRQHLLDGSAYIDMDERGLSYQQYLCRKSGGGLFELRRDGDNSGNTCAASGCAVIERDSSAADSGGTVIIKELLLSPSCRAADAVRAAMHQTAAEKYLVRTLPVQDNTDNRRFGMMAGIAGCPNIPDVYSAKWYGLAFD